jgi:hypothetical protein
MFDKGKFKRAVLENSMDEEEESVITRVSSMKAV